MAKILVADDEPALLDVLRRTLEFEGHSPFLASDGETTLRRIEAEEPDVVLLDVMMPIIDGWGVLQRMAEMDLGKRPRVIIVTAKGGEREVAKAVQLGACEYVTKPFDLDGLVATIAKVLGSSDAEIDRRRDQLMEGLSN